MPRIYLDANATTPVLPEVFDAVPRIYLDANATTPVLPEVFDAMAPFLRDDFGNASSAHQAGQRTRAAVEAAREAVARLLGASAREVVFTSGGTEGDNLALSGVLQPFLDRGEPAHLVTTAIEHHAVLHAAEALERRGIAVTFLAPGADGVVDPAAVAAALRPETRLVSVMLANNETGAVQPLGKIARLVKSSALFATIRPPLIHTDAVQGAGKLPIDLAGEFKNVDLLTLSGHKMYAPQGTGALFVRRGVELQPLFYGGPHERQRRAGTENVAGVVALGRAAEMSSAWIASCGMESLAALRSRLESALLARVDGAVLQASSTQRVCNTACITFPGVDGEALLIALDVQGVAASFGAACQSGATEPSHVLLAMGVAPRAARSTLRFSATRITTLAEIEQAAEIVAATVERLRFL